MSRRIDPTTVMWAQACDLLQQADRMHRQFFRLTNARSQAWEPPVDVFEDENDVVVVVAMPGVAPDRVQIVTEPGALTVRGERPLPLTAGTRALVHQLEIPYGYFERRISLPQGTWQSLSHELSNGCLVLRLRK
jgi:HSP20 family protein